MGNSPGLRGSAVVAFTVWIGASVCSPSTNQPDGGSPDAGVDSGHPDSGSPDAGDAGATGQAFQIPGEAPYDTWTWKQFDNSTCANGSPAGIGLNPHAGSSDLLIYFEGGGACWDYDNCVANPTAAFLDGGVNQFILDILTGGSQLFFRGDSNNPFRNFNLVYVPYCTADVHTGSKATAYDGGWGTFVVKHMGYSNVTAYLERIVPTFSTAGRVVITGSSAGGFGALFNYGRIRDDFPAAATYLIDDCGPPIRPPYFTDTWYQTQAAAWGSVANAPAGCSLCDPNAADGGLFQLIPYYAERADFRGSLIESERDETISGFGALAPGNPLAACLADGSGPCQFYPGLGDLHDHVISPSAPGQWNVYFVDGGHHVFLSEMRAVSQSGAPLEQWLSDQVDNDAGWHSVVP